MLVVRITYQRHHHHDSIKDTQAEDPRTPLRECIKRDIAFFMSRNNRMLSEWVWRGNPTLLLSRFAVENTRLIAEARQPVP